jgi:hypothetical protein
VNAVCLSAGVQMVDIYLVTCKYILRDPPHLPKEKKKLHGLSPRANYTDRAIAGCQRSDCQPLRIEGATWSA